MSYPQARRSYYLFFNYLFFNYLSGGVFGTKIWACGGVFGTNSGIWRWGVWYWKTPPDHRHLWINPRAKAPPEAPGALCRASDTGGRDALRLLKPVGALLGPGKGYWEALSWSARIARALSVRSSSPPPPPALAPSCPVRGRSRRSEGGSAIRLDGHGYARLAAGVADGEGNRYGAAWGNFHRDLRVDLQ